MAEIKDLISDSSHRPFVLPTGGWSYYQEWNHALFLHWVVPFDIIRKLVPNGLAIDTFDNRCYVSLVGFQMEKIRPRFLPSLDFISNFAEINIRTYVSHSGKNGVYFLNIEAEKAVSAIVARILSGLPYEKADIHRTVQQFTSVNSKKGFHLSTTFEVQNEIEKKTELDSWLTERYSLYLQEEKNLFRYDIHHREWKIREVQIKELNLQYQIGGVQLTNYPDLVHYSDGVKVIAWNKQKI